MGGDVGGVERDGQMLLGQTGQWSEWGKWGMETEIRFEYASILPYLILLALAVTVGHLFCINKHGGRV